MNTTAILADLLKVREFVSRNRDVVVSEVRGNQAKTSEKKTLWFDLARLEGNANAVSLPNLDSGMLVRGKLTKIVKEDSSVSHRLGLHLFRDGACASSVYVACGDIDNDIDVPPVIVRRPNQKSFA